MGTATKTLQYRYDSRGNRSALIDHDGGRFTYSYDGVNRIKEVLNPQGDRTSYSYDSAGRRTLKKLANGTRASFTYDAAGNLTKLYNLKSSGAVISSFDYTYDKVGNRMAVLEAGGSRVTWSYDNAYQLTGEHRTGANAYRDTYTYDPAGNRLLKNHDGARTTYAYDVANQLSYSQDASGRTTFTFDADGNQQVVREPSGDRTTYAWDYENRMTSARLPSGIRNTMAYDADGLRVKLEESTGTKKFVWDDQNYLGETDAANDTQVLYTNEPRLYGNLLSQRRGATSHWYHFDALGSTRDLSDASAVITDTRLFDAWGNAVASTGSTVSPLGWVGSLGYYFDTQTGLHYVRARVYQPNFAQWMSRDPMQFRDDAAAYRYSHNASLSLFDPSGALCQQQEPDDPADLCQEALERNNVDEPIEVPAGPTRASRAAGPCRVAFGCAGQCGPNGESLGWTPLPNGDRVIQVCISTRLGNSTSYDVVIAHELEHARRFCQFDPGAVLPASRTCRTREREERRAYRESCRLVADPSDPANRTRYDRCVTCGVKLSMAGVIVNGQPCEDDIGDCTPADLGITLA